MPVLPLRKIFETIRSNPSILRQDIPAMVAKLQSQAKADSQGTGNKVTAQEASFAAVLESNGVQFQPKDAQLPTVPGYYYLYQVNGSQKSIDFQVFEFDGTAIIRKFDLDLKHTSSNVFFLNDGWFIKDVIYIVTWNRRTSQPSKPITSEATTFIGLGQNIPSDKENKLMDEIKAIKTRCNTEFKGVDSLCTFIRFANRYKCEGFTPEYTDEGYAAVITYLQSVDDSPSLSPSSTAPLTA